MSNKWLWVIIGLVVAGCGVNTTPEVKQVTSQPAPRPLTFQERKERGLLTSEEQRIVDGVEKMKAVNREYEKKRRTRVAREQAEKAAYDKSVAARDEMLHKKTERVRDLERDIAEVNRYLEFHGRVANSLHRDADRKARWQHGLPTQEPTFWERLFDPDW